MHRMGACAPAARSACSPMRGEPGEDGGGRAAAARSAGTAVGSTASSVCRPATATMLPSPATHIQRPRASASSR